jgi:3-dehydroquinate dehydratase / shikimate dehydrogenase
MSERRASICGVIAETTVEAARAAIKRAAAFTDLIELRLDYLRDFDFSNSASLWPLLEDKPCPVIITCRSITEGGAQAVDDDTRLSLLVEGARRMADYCDIEAACYEAAVNLSPIISKLVVSYHNFASTPPDLMSVYDRITCLPAAMHKIATRANTITDSLAIFRLLDRAQSEGRDLIALAMQEPGLITRILGPGRGSRLTYASLGPGKESAPGQIRCEDLRELYRSDELTRDTAITGIIGKPVGHSASPVMHNRAFRSLGLDMVYLPLEVDDVEEFFTRFVREETREMDWRARGFSVTIPHKSRVIPLLDEIDKTAILVGAVNTVVISEGSLKGYNTDVEGAIEPLEAICSLDGERCGVIGAGGAARAVTYGLIARGARVTVFARDATRALPFAESFGVRVQPLESLGASDVQAIINTTPVGMRGHSEHLSPVPRSALRNRKVAYDLVYNPLETQFLKDAKAEGCKTISGIEMLIAQAALQFELWTARQAPVDLMRQGAIEKLSSQM